MSGCGLSADPRLPPAGYFRHKARQLSVIGSRRWAPQEQEVASSNLAGPTSQREMLSRVRSVRGCELSTTLREKCGKDV